jgi:adenosylhomocysteine nucleosidase
MRIGIIAALPGELKPLVRGWEKLPTVRDSGIKAWQRRDGSNEVVAVCAGMGAAAARRAFTAAEFLGALDVVYSIGWAGATMKHFVPEACFLVSEVIDAQTGERFECSLQGESKLKLVTTAQVADAGDKRRLWASYQAGMVDMEAATVARLAQMRGIPFACVKAISDDFLADLPNLNRFIGLDGQLEMGRFLGYLALHPGYLPAMASLGMHSAAAAKKLATAVESLLAGKSLTASERLGVFGG